MLTRVRVCAAALAVRTVQMRNVVVMVAEGSVHRPALVHGLGVGVLVAARDSDGYYSPSRQVGLERFHLVRLLVLVGKVFWLVLWREVRISEWSCKKEEVYKCLLNQ